MKMAVKARLLAIGNLIATAAALTLNALANIIPINGVNTGQVSDSIPNLFVPAGITFSIWGLIYLLTLFFTVYQLVLAFSQEESKQGLAARVGIWYILVSLGNAAWILAWHYRMIPLSVALMLLILFSLVVFYQKANPNSRKSSGIMETMAFRVMAGVYLGWISVATIANITALFVSMGLGNLWPGAVFWTIFLLITAGTLAIIIMFTRNDAAYALVTAWAVLGIFLKRQKLDGPHEITVTAAVICIIILAAAIAQAIRNRFFKKTVS